MSGSRFIGINYKVGEEGKSITWHENCNLGEAELVVISSTAVWEAKVNKHTEDTQNKVSELVSAVQRGLKLVILIDGLFCNNPLQQLNGIKLGNTPPFNLIKESHKESGNTVIPAEPTLDIWDSSIFSHLTEIEYEVVIDSTEATPLLIAGKGHAGPDKVTACYQKMGDGLILFMPSKTIMRPEHYVYTLYSIATAISDLNLVSPIIEWSKDFCFQDELSLRKEIAQKEEIIEKAKTSLEEIENEILTKHAPLKKLFTSSDRIFEEAVKSALKEIGYDAVFGPTGHADLVAYDGKTLLALEAKGIFGPIKEGHISQASKWVAELDTVLYMEEDEITDEIDLKYLECLKELGLNTGAERSVNFSKGVVICNTYCQLPLDQRDDDFSIKVPENLTRRHICGLTGLQLLGMLLDVRKSEAQAEKYRQEIVGTDGVLSGFEDYTKFLTKNADPVNDNEQENAA